MHARVTTVQFHPDKLEQANQMAESITAAIRQQHGLKSVLELLDRNTGKGMLISVFETEADAKAGVGSGFVQQQVDKVASLLVGVPTVEFYEVDSQE